MLLAVYSTSIYTACQASGLARSICRARIFPLFYIRFAPTLPVMGWQWLRDALIDPEFNRKRRFLQRVPLFCDIPRREFGTLFNALVERRYDPGEIMFQEGEIGRALYILETGHVEISRRNAQAQFTRVAVMNPGDYFGEMSLLDELPRSATAAAMQPVRAYLLYKTELEKVVRISPRVGAAIMTHLAGLLAARVRAINRTNAAAPYSLSSTASIKDVA